MSAVLQRASATTWSATPQAGHRGTISSRGPGHAGAPFLPSSEPANRSLELVERALRVSAVVAGEVQRRAAAVRTRLRASRHDLPHFDGDRAFAVRATHLGFEVVHGLLAARDSRARHLSVSIRSERRSTQSSSKDDRKKAPCKVVGPGSRRVIRSSLTDEDRDRRGHRLDAARRRR